MDRSLVAPLARLIRARHWALLGLFIGIGLPLLLFGSLADEVWEGEGLPFDLPILRWLHGLAGPALDRLALALSLVGGPLPMIALAALLTLGLWWRRQRHRAILFLAIVGGSALLNLLGKIVFRRERPDLWLSLAPEGDYSFPSGHAMGSMALVAALVFLTWRGRWRWPILIGGGALRARRRPLAPLPGRPLPLGHPGRVGRVARLGRWCARLLGGAGGGALGGARRPAASPGGTAPPLARYAMCVVCR